MPINPLVAAQQPMMPMQQQMMPLQQPGMLPQMSGSQQRNAAIFDALGVAAGPNASRLNPFDQAFQRSQQGPLQQQSLMIQQQRMKMLQDRQMASMMKLDPSLKFRALKAQGLLPQEMTWEEFEKSGMASGGQDASTRGFLSLMDAAGLSQEDRQQALRIKLGLAPRQVGTGDMTLAEQDDSTKQDVLEIVQDKSGAKASGTGIAETQTADFNEFKDKYLMSREAYKDLDVRINRVDDGLSMFDGKDRSKQVDTGLISGFVDDFLGMGGVNTGKLRTMGLQEALDALAAFKGPTTDFEFTKAELSSFASLYQNEQVNVGTLQTVRDALSRAQKDIERDSKEYYEGMRGAAREGEFERINQAFKPLPNWDWARTSAEPAQSMTPDEEIEAAFEKMQQGRGGN